LVGSKQASDQATDKTKGIRPDSCLDCVLLLVFLRNVMPLSYMHKQTKCKTTRIEAWGQFTLEILP